MTTLDGHYKGPAQPISHQPYGGRSVSLSVLPDLVLGDMQGRSLGLLIDGNDPPEKVGAELLDAVYGTDFCRIHNNEAPTARVQRDLFRLEKHFECGLETSTHPNVRPILRNVGLTALTHFKAQRVLKTK